MDRYDELTLLLRESTKRHFALLDERWQLTPECPKCMDRRSVFKVNGKWFCGNQTNGGILICTNSFKNG